MKKVLLTLTVAAMFAACGNKSETTTEMPAETTPTEQTTPEEVTPMDTTMVNETPTTTPGTETPVN